MRGFFDHFPRSLGASGRRPAAFIFSVVLLLLAGESASTTVRKFLGSHPVLTALVTGSLLVLITSLIVDKAVARREEARYRPLAHEATQALQRALQDVRNALRVQRDLVKPASAEVNASRGVSRQARNPTGFLRVARDTTDNAQRVLTAWLPVLMTQRSLVEATNAFASVVKELRHIEHHHPAQLMHDLEDLEAQVDATLKQLPTLIQREWAVDQGSPGKGVFAERANGAAVMKIVVSNESEPVFHEQLLRELDEIYGDVTRSAAFIVDADGYMDMCEPEDMMSQVLDRNLDLKMPLTREWDLSSDAP